MKSQPFVSVVTPFYNTATYLRDCIESVLASTYENFEYILADNKSTDGSRAIAEEYASRDHRIKLHTNDEFLGQVANYNNALRLVSDTAAYIKIVQADDWIYPECITRMVELAERYPSAGIVSSYYLVGKEVKGDGLEIPRELIPGREVCRRQLLDGLFVFGTPTNILLRSRMVRAQDDFFDPESLHDDTDACYRELQTWDLAFVHQVLSYCRVDPDSITGRVADLNPHALDKFLVWLKYGRQYLSAEEFERYFPPVEREYLRTLVDAAVMRDTSMLNYHLSELRKVGYRPEPAVLLKAAALQGAHLVGNPKSTVSSIIKKLRGVE